MVWREVAEREDMNVTYTSVSDGFLADFTGREGLSRRLRVGPSVTAPTQTSRAKFTTRRSTWK
jgi:hypothetical protein